MTEVDLWIAELATELDLDTGSIDSALLLNLARLAAHTIARPAAPLTTFMVGLAAGTRGSDPAVIATVIEAAQRLLLDHERAPGPQLPPTSPPGHRPAAIS